MLCPSGSASPTPSAFAPAAFLQCVIEVRATGAHGGQRAGENRGDHRCGDDEEQNTPINRDLFGAGQLVGEARVPLGAFKS